MGDIWEDYPEFRFNPSVQSWGAIDDPDPAIAFWRNKTVTERFRAAEFLRRLNHGRNRTVTQIPRVVEVIDRRAG